MRFVARVFAFVGPNRPPAGRLPPITIVMLIISHFFFIVILSKSNRLWCGVFLIKWLVLSDFNWVRVYAIRLYIFCVYMHRDFFTFTSRNSSSVAHRNRNYIILALACGLWDLRHHRDVYMR